VPSSGHLMPLGQHTSPGSISLMACLVQLKQNLWSGTEGHCTKSEPSRRPWQFRQFISSSVAGFSAVFSSVLGCSGATGAGAAGSVLTTSAAVEEGGLGAGGCALSGTGLERVVGMVAVLSAEVWIGRVLRVEEMEDVAGEKAESDFKLERLS